MEMERVEQRVENLPLAVCDPLSIAHRLPSTVKGIASLPEPAASAVWRVLAMTSLQQSKAESIILWQGAPFCSEVKFGFHRSACDKNN